MEAGVIIKGSEAAQAALKAFPGKAHRACAVAINKTGKAVKLAEQKEMQSVFDRPTRYTLNSLKLDPADKNNLQASVWFKEPDRNRTSPHYLFPQVEGGQRNLKGFERAFGEEFVPGAGVRLNKFGNVTGGQIVQIMSVLGKFNRYAGDNSNITRRSRKQNTRERDYVYLPKGSGKLPPGIYKRVQSGVGFGAKTKRTFADRSRSYQKGRRRGRFASVIRARGLKPILIHGRTGHRVKPLLDFYGIANKTIDREFDRTFWATLDKFLKS